MDDKAHKIKVAVYLVIDVDVDAYNAEYGTDDSVTQIRDDIKSRSREAADAAFAHLPSVFVR